MERATDWSSGADQPRQRVPRGSGDLLITDETVQELKRQAPDGCVLCELEGLDQEDWD